MFQHYVAVINLLLARETIQLVPPEARPAPQRVSKMQYPLVLLDQQLQAWSGRTNDAIIERQPPRGRR